jgi:hypothetical protein
VGVTVTLVDENDNVIDSTATDGTGGYIFEGVPPGDYRVIQSVPPGFVAIDDADGGDLTINGDEDPIVVGPAQSVTGQDFVNSQWGQIEAPEVCPDVDVTITATFLRPSGLPGNVAYSIEYAAALAAPTSWCGPVLLGASNSSVIDNGNGTETVTINDVEAITGLISGSGFVRVRVDLDADNSGTPDETVFSDVFGWYDTVFGTACVTYNDPFLACPTAVGGVVGVAGNTLTLNVEPVLDPAVAYYIEITDGDFEGHRFDVVSATGFDLLLAESNDLCDFAAPFNTLAGAPSVQLVGANFTLRAHRTLNDVFPPDVFQASGSPSSADQITFFDGDSIICYWLFDDAGSPRWVLAGDETLADQGNAVVPPGRGAFVDSRSAKTVRAFGRVRANDFILPLREGKTLVGGGFPVDQSAIGRGMTNTAGFLGDADYKFADQFLLWRGDFTAGANSYDAYYLLIWADSFNQWTRAADVSLTDRNEALLFLRNRAVFLERREADLPTYTMPLPWNP